MHPADLFSTPYPKLHPAGGGALFHASQGQRALPCAATAAASLIVGIKHNALRFPWYLMVSAACAAAVPCVAAACAAAVVPFMQLLHYVCPTLLCADTCRQEVCHQLPPPCLTILFVQHAARL